MAFNQHLDSALVSPSGEDLALRADGTYLEPGVSVTGTEAVFSRTSAGWAMKSLVTPEMDAQDEVEPQLFSPALSLVAFESLDRLTLLSSVFEVGSVGGPYATVASVQGPSAEFAARFVGANAGTPSGVREFSDVVFSSGDHALLPAGPEREAAEQTEPGLEDLYESTGGSLRLVNMGNGGKPINPCGAELGSMFLPAEIAGNAVNAVSADGSKIFFTSPQEPNLRGCPAPALYMRVDDRETVDVSEPEGVSVAPSERAEVFYNGASADGSKVFFTTTTALIPGAGGGYHLYEYDTEAAVGHRLTLIANEAGSAQVQRINPGVVVSEAGSAVYYSGVCAVEERGQRAPIAGICRYETATEKTSFVAVPRETAAVEEPWSVTPNGDFFLFASGNSSAPQPVEFLGPHGLEPEVRGAGPHEELYRYDAADGSVMCVSCGVGVAPEKGSVREPESAISAFVIRDIQPVALSMSDDGRRVFFQTTANLVPQDVNKNGVEEEHTGLVELGNGTDVYEWEQDGTEEEPGIFCEVANGCTYLISAGEDVGPERFLGASASGDDVFFTSAAQLAPQATPEFTNIYDARVGGGYPPPSPNVECTSCQGVGGQPLSSSLPASETLAGAGNPAQPNGPPKPKPKPQPKCRHGFKRTKHGRCLKTVSRKRTARR
jgi:hypothetical protein